MALTGLYSEDVIVEDAFSGAVPFYSTEPDLPPRCHLKLMLPLKESGQKKSCSHVGGSD
ncbi:hypothetical protein [Paenibacillus macerans]|uniref:hypothetical protein n=1 Tax=Paenibacillus macerans TaxID=44252 RepID=UPI0020415982|nr:hypothetical protein [Paenibacillus macerans]MCM3703363.1 hypothetical protein [Paenibacillus macerans]